MVDGRWLRANFLSRAGSRLPSVIHCRLFIWQAGACPTVYSIRSVEVEELVEVQRSQTEIFQSEG